MVAKLPGLQEMLDCPPQTARRVVRVVLLADRVTLLVRMPAKTPTAVFVAVVLDPKCGDAASDYRYREEFDPGCDHDRLSGLGGFADEMEGGEDHTNVMSRSRRKSGLALRYTICYTMCYDPHRGIHLQG